MFTRTIPCLLVGASLLLVPLPAAGQTPAGGAKGSPAAKPAAAAPAQVAQKGPRPETFKYVPLAFKPPKAAEFRTTLSNGLVVYIAEDHEIPWFTGSLMVRTGPFLESKDKLGVAGLTSSIMRSGGTATMTGEQINERMDFLAGTLTATSLSIRPA